MPSAAPSEPTLSGTAARGLTSAEARRLLKDCGPNAMPDVAPGYLRRAAGKFWAPVPWMLEAAVVLPALPIEIY